MRATREGALGLSSELLQGSGAREEEGETGGKSNRSWGVFLSVKTKGGFQKRGLVYAAIGVHRERGFMWVCRGELWRWCVEVYLYPGENV